MNDDRDEDLTMMMKNLGNFWEEDDDDVGFLFVRFFWEIFVEEGKEESRI